MGGKAEGMELLVPPLVHGMRDGGDTAVSDHPFLHTDQPGAQTLAEPVGAAQGCPCIQQQA